MTNPAAPPAVAALQPRALLLWLGSIHALILGSWYVLRPLRDEFATVDPSRIPMLWTWVFLVMLGASPLFGWAVTRFPRRRFVAGTLRLFGALLLLQVGLLRYGPDHWKDALETCFYVFCSVFNLFVVSVFWSFAADLLRARSAEALFGPVAACGTLGGILGSQAVSSLRSELSLDLLLLLAVLLLESGRWTMLTLDRRVSALGSISPALAGQGSLGAEASSERVQGSVLAGITAVFRSPYLLAIVVYMALVNLNGTLFYTLQSTLLKEALPEREDRGIYLADLNLYTNVFTLLGQLFLNAWLLKRLGVGLTLLALPLWGGLGLIALWQVQRGSGFDVLAIFAFIEVGRRAVSYALAKPTKEYLFTLVSRDEKYRSKNFIDTVVYRGSDLASSSVINWMIGAGVSLASVTALGLIPVALWAALTAGLGRHAKARRHEVDQREGTSAAVKSTA
jgi:AAA family ATP:ADP antiporter